MMEGAGAVLGFSQSQPMLMCKMQKEVDKVDTVVE